MAAKRKNQNSNPIKRKHKETEDPEEDMGNRDIRKFLSKPK